MHYVWTFITLILLTGLNCEDDDLQDLIDEIFKSPPVEIDRKTDGDPESECVCVPYYLCDNNTIITNGVGLIDIRSYVEPCESYLDVCCKKPLSDSDKITPKPPIKDGCGTRNPEGIGFKITGNENGEIQFGEFPWMVGVLKEEEIYDEKAYFYKCGGALIHPEVVLTAAQCVKEKNKSYKIRAGEWDAETDNEPFPHQDVNVKNIVVHPKYYWRAFHNDVALLFLESPLTLANNIDVICLPKQDEPYDYSRCYASGWGKKVFIDYSFGHNFNVFADSSFNVHISSSFSDIPTSEEGKYQQILKKVELRVMPRKQCQSALQRYKPDFNLHQSLVCARSKESGKGICKGDGGSPLICPIPNSSNKFVQIGIVAWGLRCGDKGTPDLYANVASFMNWIDETLVKNNLSTRYYEY